MNTIRIYKPNEEEYERLRTVACLVQVKTGCPTTVEDVYFDLGQGWMWTTIVTYHPEDKKRSYQMLYPKQHEQVVNGTMEDMVHVATELIKEHLYV